MFQTGRFRPAAASSHVREFIGLHDVPGDIECAAVAHTSSGLRDELFH